MALTVSEMFKQYAGRDIDSASADYWGKQFGSQVDPGEIELFKQAIVKDVLSGKEKAAFTTDWWNNLSADQKITFFNQAEATSEQLKNLGVSEKDISWMRSQGYTGGAAPVAAAPTTATTAPASAAVPVKTIGEAPNRPVLPSLKDQILWQWKTLGITDIPGGLSLEDRAAGLAERLQANQITDLSQLGLKRLEANVDEEGNATPALSQLTYDGRTIGFLGNIGDGGRNASPTGYLQGGDLASWSALGEGATSYYARQAPNGQVYLVPSWGQTGGLQALSGIEKALLLGASAVAAPWVAGQIGAATGLTGAGLSAATGATIGGTTGLLTGGDLESALKGALLGGAGGYLGSSLTGAATPTDLGMNSQLTPAAIEAGLGTPGYGFNASAAQSGLFNPAMIGAGAYTQTSYPYDMADFLAADVKQLYGQVGSNIPAIEQNLVASGVDPLVAADVANQVTLNPNISQYDLTNYIASNFGGNVYDVNMATQSPTSPQGDYSNEGRNYPTTISTIGTGGSPVNASIAGGLTAGKVLDAVSTGAKVAGLLGAGSAVAGESGKGFEIVPIPSDWRTPTYTQAAARTLPPIDFGTRELLRGTQWEKFLNPAQPAIVPAPQVGMNYGDLMNVLQNRQGGTLTLNDIISGITSQYGQTTPSAVG